GTRRVWIVRGGAASDGRRSRRAERGGFRQRVAFGTRVPTPRAPSSSYFSTMNRAAARERSPHVPHFNTTATPRRRHGAELRRIRSQPPVGSDPRAADRDARTGA